MPVEMLTYSALGERLNCSPQAARALAKRLRLPRQRANDGKALVAVDLAELTHKPMRARSPAGDHPITATLKGRVVAERKDGGEHGCPCSNLHKAEKHWRFSRASRTVAAW